ncbi:YozQ family protein [Halobacillus locisalis]|nr:YozQ family protein [Halobacillus locisalis]
MNRRPKNDQGFKITEEQAKDSYMEGTIDGSIDQVDDEGNLISHDGEPLSRERFPKGRKQNEQKK